MQTVNKQELKQWINEKEDVFLIDVLPKEDFDKRSIPGSINVPFKNNENFISEVDRRVLSKDARIVVYCSNINCSLSEQAAQKLDNAGYSNVYAFEEGVEGWLEKDQTAA